MRNLSNGKIKRIINSFLTIVTNNEGQKLSRELWEKLEMKSQPRNGKTKKTYITNKGVTYEQK